MNDIKTTCLAYVPYDRGFMYTQGLRFSEDSVKYTIEYDGNAVPYIPYQEYGFTHYLSGKRVEVNKGFIQNDTVNALDFLINQATANEKSLIQAANKRTVQSRENMLAQGTLTSLKGNTNR